MKPDDTTIEKIHDYLCGVLDAEKKMQFEKELQENASLREEVATQQEIIQAVENTHNYLSGIMDTEEKMQFDKKLQTNAFLREEVTMQQEIIYAVRRMAMAEQLRQLQQEVLKEEGLQGNKQGNQGSKIVPIRPYARIIRIGLAVAGIAAVLVLGFWIAPLLQNYLFPEPTVTVAVPQQSEFVSPIKGLEVPAETLELEAEKGKTFRLPSGTQINVPPNVFTDEKGAKVSGKVQIVYREYHDGLEVLASGIPLEIDGKQQETVGMFEIRGYRNGEPLTLNGSIDIQLASFTDSPGYSHFHLASHRIDESTGQPIVQWQQIAGLSELIINARKQAYFDSLKKVYYEQAEAHAKTAFENQQLKAQENTVNGWQLKTVKSNVIMSWLNTQGMEYIGFQPEYQDPESEEMSWVKAAKWQKAHAAVASFMPMAQVNVPSISGNFIEARFSNDGKKLILKAGNNTLLYHSNGQLISKIAMKDAVFTSDGEHLIGLSEKKELLCYRTSDGAFVTQYGQLIPTNSREYDPKMNNTERAITTHVGQIMDYDISPDGQRVVTVHTDESTILWEIGGKMISRRKGLPKSWITEIMFTNRNGTEMIGKMHDGTILRLNDQWQSLGRSNSFSRPPGYDGGLSEKKWAMVHSNQTLKQPDIDINRMNSNIRMVYKNVAQHVFYINQKQQDTWKAVDTLYVAGVERASAYAIAPDGQRIALLLGKDKLQIWQKTDTDKQIYRLSLEGASFEAGSKILDASQVHFYTYVQPGGRPQVRQQPRLATFEELRRRNLKVADQKLQLAREQHTEEADYLRVFHVTKFGIYHVTRPFEEVKVTYSHLIFSAENSSGTMKLFQLAGAERTVIIPLGEFSLNNPSPVTFDASGGHLVGVLPDGTVLVFAARDFADWLRENAVQENATPQLVFKRIDPSEVNYRKLKQVLEQS
jgi:anti-sigma-K factor RskA